MLPPSYEFFKKCVFAKNINSSQKKNLDLNKNLNLGFNKNIF